jgi:hypothetical protein
LVELSFGLVSLQNSTVAIAGTANTREKVPINETGSEAVNGSDREVVAG